MTNGGIHLVDGAAAWMGGAGRTLGRCGRSATRWSPSPCLAAKRALMANSRGGFNETQSSCIAA